MQHGQLGGADGETDKSKDATGAALERPSSWFQLGGDCGYRVDSTVRAKVWRGHIFTCSVLDINGGGGKAKRITNGLKIMVYLEATHLFYRNDCANVARCMYKDFHFTAVLKS